MPTTTPMKNRAIQAVLTILLALGLPVAGFAQNFTVSPTPFQTALDNSGNVINNACVWTYLAGTTTQATTYSDNAGTPNLNPIRSDPAGRFTSYLVAGTNYKYVYEASCTPPAHATVLRTADNIAGVPASSATVDVTGTAGETISAGRCAYLSDGSGSKVAGQWYQCDSANTYSSTLPTLGIAPSAITSGASGTIRISGSVPGLSALSVGSTYYVSTGGTLTTTAPANQRFVGVADTTTTVIVTANPVVTAPNADNSIDDFRLSFNSGIPVTTADVTAATTLLCTPYKGNRIALFSSAGVATILTSAEFSIAVPATTSQMYDVFAFNNSGVATLELLAWTNDTTRATAIVLTTTGAYTKSGDLTRRYLGSFRTTTVSGQSEDSLTKRYLWNYYNRVMRPMLRIETTASWAYTLAAWRQVNASALNQLDFVIGVSEGFVNAQVIHFADNSSVNVVVATSIGVDSTSAPASNQIGLGITLLTVNLTQPLSAQWSGYPGVGRHLLAWLEFSTATGTTTWRSASNNIVGSGGIRAWFEG